MENVKFRAWSTCILILVVVCNFLFSDGISWTKYNVDIFYSGFRCIPSLTAFETNNAAEESACGKLCHRNNMCISFFYQQDNHTCIGCTLDLLGQGSQGLAKRLPGSTYYRRYGADCKDILQTNPAATSGIYEIKPRKSKSTIKVFCDMEISGGGWTVFHNRFDGSVDFYRNLTDYEYGFGDMAGEFWLGFKYIQEMSMSTESVLLLEATAQNGDTGYEIVYGFIIENGNKYGLHFEQMSYYHKIHGMTYADACLPRLLDIPFNTMDRDTYGACVEDWHSAWWYTDCGGENCNLHGKYGASEPTSYYHRGIAENEPLKASRMMFRRNR